MPFNGDFIFFQVDGHPAFDFDAFSLGRAVLSSEDRFHPGDELFGRERLGDVIIGAQLQAQDLVGLIAPGGDHDHRDGSPLLLPPQELADLQPIDIGEHEIKKDQVGDVFLQRIEKTLTIGKAVRPEARPLEMESDEVDDIRLIIDHGNELVHGMRLAYYTLPENEMARLIPPDSLARSKLEPAATPEA